MSVLSSPVELWQRITQAGGVRAYIDGQLKERGYLVERRDVAAAGGVGLITAAFYGWLPLYLPELFPTAVRATGQGFGFNFGRVLASIGSLQTGALLAAFGNDYAKACSVAAGVYVLGLVLITFAPETKGKELPM